MFRSTLVYIWICTSVAASTCTGSSPGTAGGFPEVELLCTATSNCEDSFVGYEQSGSSVTYYQCTTLSNGGCGISDDECTRHSHVPHSHTPLPPSHPSAEPSPPPPPPTSPPQPSPPMIPDLSLTVVTSDCGGKMIGASGMFSNETLWTGEPMKVVYAINTAPWPTMSCQTTPTEYDWYSLITTDPSASIIMSDDFPSNINVTLDEDGNLLLDGCASYSYIFNTDMTSPLTVAFHAPVWRVTGDSAALTTAKPCDYTPPPSPPPTEICYNDCGHWSSLNFANNTVCEDGGPGSDDPGSDDGCLYGHDCIDCGPRPYLPPAPPSLPPSPPQPPSAPPSCSAPYSLAESESGGSYTCPHWFWTFSNTATFAPIQGPEWCADQCTYFDDCYSFKYIDSRSNCTNQEMSREKCEKKAKRGKCEDKEKLRNKKCAVTCEYANETIYEEQPSCYKKARKGKCRKKKVRDDCPATCVYDDVMDSCEYGSNPRTCIFYGCDSLSQLNATDDTGMYCL